MYQYCIYHNIVAAIESFRALINRHSGCAEKPKNPFIAGMPPKGL
jgi:hypothetical protein